MTNLTDVNKLYIYIYLYLNHIANVWFFPIDPSNEALFFFPPLKEKKVVTNFIFYILFFFFFFSFQLFFLLWHTAGKSAVSCTSVAAAKHDQTKAQTKHLFSIFQTTCPFYENTFFFLPLLRHASLFFFFPSSQQGNHLSHIHLYKLISSLQEKIKTMATEIPVSEG